MAGTKRQHHEVDAPDDSRNPNEPISVLDSLRGMWEFANLVQYLALFGKVLKIDHDLSIENIETLCCFPGTPQILLDIGLIMLKLISTQRGLNLGLFDDYMRKEYRKRLARELESKQFRGDTHATLEVNPFGVEDEETKSFKDFDVCTQIRILQRLSQWTLTKPEILREKMNESESDQLLWRMELYGWDAQDREYFLLDDNRLYRQTEAISQVAREPSPPPWKPKANTKKAKAARRASRRLERLAANQLNSDTQSNEADDAKSNEPSPKKARTDELSWECVAVTLEQYKDILDSLKKTRDPNEKKLRARIVEDVLPQIEKAEEEQKRKAAKHEKEMINLQKIAGAKRSGRLAAKQDREKAEEEALQEAKAKEAEQVMARKEEQRARKLEEERNSRLFSREQRANERDSRRALREEELATLEMEVEAQSEDHQARISERRRKAREESLRREIDELNEADWYFDCSVCGVHGRNQDDGTPIIACDKCSVWQHVACLGLQVEVASDDFEFTCSLCLERIKAEKRAALNPPIKLKLKRSEMQSSSPPTSAAPYTNGYISKATPNHNSLSRSSHSPSPTRQAYSNGSTSIAQKTPSVSRPSADNNLMNGPSLSPTGQLAGSIASKPTNLDHSTAQLTRSFEQHPVALPSKSSAPTPQTNGISPSPALNPNSPSLNGAPLSWRPHPPSTHAHPTQSPSPTPSRPESKRTHPSSNHAPPANPSLFDKDSASPRVNLPSSSPAGPSTAANGASPTAYPPNQHAASLIPPPSAGRSPTKHMMPTHLGMASSAESSAGGFL
ncbi:MAG: hypothetical protein M1814_003038 [Vezdaea aestivalis]|nr:MAG: hypothetical protein M1814_003038 [Vezdaea aestivalis]